VSSTKYIAAIDGLRAIAVLAVILFHAFPTAIPGGFIGVDIFFVISGYLITNIIVTQAGSGIFSFKHFYARRIRRIFPALIIVLVSVYALGWFVMLADEFKQLGKHIAAGAGFVANWAYWLESGYFDELHELKPLLNLWSLGVEEQFYIFWPCIVLLLMKLKMRLRGTLLFLVGISFLLNILFIKDHQSATFFLPFSRFWELGLGGILAVEKDAATKFKLNPTATFITGALAILTPMFLLSSQSLFPGWVALAPVLGTALILISMQAGSIGSTLLSNRVLVNLGLISYPLYLWHWPVFSFARLMKGESLAFLESMTLLIFSGILASSTYFLLEKRVRHQGTKTVFILCILLIAIGFQGWNTYKREGLEYRLRKTIEIPENQKRDFVKWENKGMLPIGSCDPGFIYPEAHVCAQSNPERNADIVIMGDSHAFSAYWGIAKSYADSHVVRLLGQGGCAPFLNAGSFGAYPSCDKNINSQLAWLSKNPNIKTVFIVHRNSTLISDTERSAYKAAIKQTFDLLLTSNKKVIYVYSVPELNFEPRLCVGNLPLGRKNPVDSCSYPLARELARQSSFRASILEVLGQYPSVETFDPANILCKEGVCHAVIDDRVMYTDTNHLSESGSYMQGIEIKKQFPLNY
jgi:peptidoglycan/LPS O-acetylase OafA/YrhL